MNKKKAYFIGIAGKTMAPLAKAFQGLGWQVSGSDHKGIYPPMSTYLLENKISYTEGYNQKNVPLDADLVVAGRSALLVDPQNPEYLRAKELNLNVKSYPEVLADYLVKKNSVVISGTYGKTTISSLVTWILENAGLNPSYMTGGICLNLKDGVKITNSNYSVVEGDESPALFETDPPKFMFYKPKYLFLTATKWDHPEVFKNEKEYLKAFKKLVQLLPSDGFLIYNKDSVSRFVLEKFSGRKLSYSFADLDADFWVKEVIRQKEKTFFKVSGENEIFDLQTVLLGDHNLENICGAIALCSSLNIKKEIIEDSVKSFLGVRTRLEFLGKFGGRFLYWDLAQHPQKVKGTVFALRQHYPKERIIVVYHPAASGLKYRQILPTLANVFDPVDRVIVAKAGSLKGISKKDRLSGLDLTKAIAKTQKNVFYQPVKEKIIDYLQKNTKEGEVIVFLSSGGLEFVSLIEETKKKLNEK